MTTMTPAYPGFAVDAETHLRIVRALGRMPYLPLANTTTKPASGADLAVLLEKFAEALAYVGERSEEEHRELQQMRSDLAAVGRVLALAAKEA